MATASDPRQHLHSLVDQLTDQQLPQAAQALEAIQRASLEAALRTIPGLRIPDKWPPHYPTVEPVSLPGESVAEQLIRDRR